jgi:hypothetical protein
MAFMQIILYLQKIKQPMKKLTLILALALGSVTLAHADKYKMDEQQLEQAFATSTEVSFDEMVAADMSVVDLSSTKMAASGSKTRGGYLLRSFFCGGIALHRYYMGTTKGYMWALYCLVPVAGGLAGCVDFWGAVFVADFYKKYENNDKWFVWLD